MKCKGYRDLLPQDIVKFRHIEEVFRAHCLKGGYEEVKTPTLEYLHLFTSAGTLTPNKLSKVYSFLDWDGWSGERVVLRPEGTIPTARLYSESLGKPKIARLFYVENIFSFEQTGKESRERWQCGAELIGAGEPAADVELILLACETLKELGYTKVELRLSHIGLLRALLQGLELAPPQEDKILDQILDGDTKALSQIIGDNPLLKDSLPLLFQSRGKSPGFLRNLKVSLGKALPQLEQSLDNFIAITELLSAMGYNYQIDIASGEGFEYYTGIIFQFYLEGKKVGAGGRYDNLIPLIGGEEVPASGFALYLDQLADSLELKEALAPRILIKKQIEDWKSGFQAASSLREAGYITELDFGQEGSNFRWVLIIRESPSPFLLLDQATHKRTEVTSISELIELLKEQSETEAGSA